MVTAWLLLDEATTGQTSNHRETNAPLVGPARRLNPQWDGTWLWRERNSHSLTPMPAELDRRRTVSPRGAWPVGFGRLPRFAPLVSAPLEWHLRCRSACWQQPVANSATPTTAAPLFYFVFSGSCNLGGRPLVMQRWLGLCVYAVGVFLGSHQDAWA